MKRIVSHWTMPFPDATRKLLRATDGDQIVRVHACAGQNTLHVTRASGRVFYAPCPESEAMGLDAALFRNESTTVWADTHRADVHRDRGVVRTVTLTIRMNQYPPDMAARAVAYASSSGINLIVALSNTPIERSAFARSAASCLVDMLPAVRDSRGDIFCGGPPPFHAVVSGPSILQSVMTQGCRAAVIDDLEDDDYNAIPRMCSTGILCVVACSAADPRLGILINSLRNVIMQIAVWDIPGDRIM